MGKLGAAYPIHHASNTKSSHEPLGAAKVSLSSFSAPDLWMKSGRYRDDNPEYRDEPRPRQGLLRTREFLMKDLYTFDAGEIAAFDTYQKVRKGYNDFFNELQVPFLVARADSGEIGGHLSHEYHIATASGEDTIISCGSCKYTYNEELVPAEIRPLTPERPTGHRQGPYQTWFGISRDRSHLYEAILPQSLEAGEGEGPIRKQAQFNTYLIRSLHPDLDLSIERPLHTFLEYWKGKRSSRPVSNTKTLTLPRLTLLCDYRVTEDFIERRDASGLEMPLRRSLSSIIGSRWLRDKAFLDLARPQTGDKCSKCGQKSLKVQQAVELGHTFNLGQRYSEIMGATFATNPSASPATPPTSAVATAPMPNKSTAAKRDTGKSTALKPGHQYFFMGCHGIGISRMIAAVADALADEQGLVWPRAMAPYEAVILATGEHMTAAEEAWDMLTRHEEGMEPVDAVLDDRSRDLGWKLKDADLLGFPVVIVLGSKFAKSRLCEVSVRRLATRQKVSVAHLRDYVASRLAKI
ncbi:MAG: hypothetical protein LQ346_002372 [Caloplaca aetnensis]|nr:MAG: hypothetical protein LQ346_002372 [Caloplaca aetnensis]